MSDAVIGFVGVLVGGAITIAKDVVVGRFRRRRKGYFAAARIICVLDQYVEQCVEVVSDDGTAGGRPAGRYESGEEYYEVQVACPAPPSFPDDIDWTSIDPDLMYRVLSLPNKAHETDRYISAEAENSFPPDYAEVFEARWAGYADLGLEALDIGNELRGAFELSKISISTRNADWDAGQFLRHKKSEMQKRKDIDRAESAAMIAEMEGHAEGNA